MSEDYLSHYGVLGMKWGVRKKTESSGGGGLRSVEEKKKIGEAVNAEAFKKDRAKAEKERKKHESELKKAAKAAAAAAKKAASAAKRGAKAASEKHAANKAKRAQEAAERARKKLENQKLREARKAEADRKKKQREAERAEKKRQAEEKKAAKEAEKKQRVPKGGITAAMRKEAPRHLTSTDLIEQNKRLNLEKQNYELKQKLKEYENQNRSVLSKTADLFVDEARKNLTTYAARAATDMLTAAIDSKLKGTEYAGIAKMAKDSFNLDAILKNSMDKKK